MDGGCHTKRKAAWKKVHCKSLIFWFQKKIEDARAQMQVLSLDKELKELQRAVVTSDKLAATELSVAANQLKALRGTVLRINQERAEVKQHGELINCLLMPLQWEQSCCPLNGLQSFLLSCAAAQELLLWAEFEMQ